MNLGQLVAPLILPRHLFLNCASFWNRPKLSTSPLTILPGLFQASCPLCLILSTSHVTQLLTYTTGPLTFLFYPTLSFILQPNITFIFPVFIFKPLASNPNFHCTIAHIDFPHCLLSRSSHVHTVIPEANLLIALW